MLWPTSADYPRRRGRSPDTLPATRQRLLHLCAAHCNGPPVPSMPKSTPTRRRTIARLRAYVDLISAVVLDLVSRGNLAELTMGLEAAEVDEFLGKLRSSREVIDGMIAALEARGEDGRPR